MMPSDSKVKGAFRLDLFPHAIELLEVFDDDVHDTITFQTAAQAGKTTLGQVVIAKTADCNPHPMAWADADERSLRRVIRRMWRLIEGTRGVAHLCPPKRMQPSDRIETSTFLVHGAWAGSASSAADYGAFVVVLNETDKMIQKSTDVEADFRYLMGERIKGYVGGKLLEFSTPTMIDSSYIEQRRKQGDNRSWQVPCPHCNHYQEMITGDKHSKGGIKFEKLNGRLDPQKAEDTAFYQCERCQKKIQEHQRYDMMHAGQWVKEGQSINSKGKLVGKPLREGRHASFGPFPTICSLLPGITIGEVAREFVAAETAPANERTQRRRNYCNSWEGRTYDPKPPAVQAHELKQRLEIDEPLRVCPLWSQFLTVGVDVGRLADDLMFYWWVSAWARQNDEHNAKRWGRRGQLVDYNITYGEDEFRAVIDEWLTVGYKHADDEGNLTVQRIGIDSSDGQVTRKIYSFCDALDKTWPIKGSSTNFPGIIEAGFRKQTAQVLPAKVLAARKKAGMGDLLLINSDQTQEWRQDQTTGMIKRESIDWYSIPSEACDDSDMLEQLIADYYEETGNGKGQWNRSGANEFGDTMRYSYAMAEHFGSRYGARWDRIPHRSAAARRRAQKKKTRRTTRDGKAFVASQR